MDPARKGSRRTGLSAGCDDCNWGIKPARARGMGEREVQQAAQGHAFDTGHVTIVIREIITLYQYGRRLANDVPAGGPRPTNRGPTPT